MCRGRMRKRSRRFGIGKEIGGAVYVHRLYDNLLPAQVQTAKLLVGEFPYQVIKYTSEKVSFIECVDFDTAPEPTVGRSMVVRNGLVKIVVQPQDPWVWHHKWLFVSDHYPGFDVQQAKRRTEWIDSLPIDRYRMGRRSYWLSVLMKYGDGPKTN